MDRNDNFQSADEVTKLGGFPRRDRLSSENLALKDLCEFNLLETRESKETSVQIIKRSSSTSRIQDVKHILHKNNSSPGTEGEIKQLFGSSSSMESSNTYDYIEHMINYELKNKGIDKLQNLNEKLFQEPQANAVLISETEFISTEIYSNKQYYDHSLDTYSEESKSKTSNINIVITSEAEAPYHVPIHTDNYFTTTETQVKESLKSYEIFNQNITKFNSDSGKTSMECEQIITDIKSVASDTVSPINYKHVHDEQNNDKKIDVDKLETTDTVGGTYLSHNFAKPLVNSQPTTPKIKTSPYIVKKSPAMSEKKTPNKSNKYDHIESPVAAYIYMPRVPVVKDGSAKKPLPSSSRKLKKATDVKAFKSNNKYQYIQSPVAAYINNCQQVPSLKDVDPKKPLPSTSKTLQQHTGSEAIKSSDKENINLPLVAESAEETKVMEIPNKNKLP